MTNYRIDFFNMTSYNYKPIINTTFIEQQFLTRKKSFRVS